MPKHAHLAQGLAKNSTDKGVDRDSHKQLFVTRMPAERKAWHVIISSVIGFISKSPDDDPGFEIGKSIGWQYVAYIEIP